AAGGGRRGLECTGGPGGARPAAGPRPRLVPPVRVRLQGLRGRHRLRARGGRAPEVDRAQATPRPVPLSPGPAPCARIHQRNLPGTRLTCDDVARHRGDTVDTAVITVV